MKRKSARRHKSRRKTKRQSSFYFWLAVLIVILALAGKTVYKNLQNANVLGKSTFLTYEFQAPPPGGSGGGVPPPQPQEQSQPQQQSKPPQEQQSQPKNQEEQKQYQQYQQQTPEQQKQTYQKYQQQDEQQKSQQNQQYQQTGQSGQPEKQRQPEQQSQSGQPGQPGQPNSQPGFAGQTPPTQEQYQQFQQQFQKEAAKFGIQFSGNLPQQFQQYQIQQNSNSQNSPNASSQGSPSNNVNAFQPLPSLKDFPTITGKFEVQSANRGQNINLNDGNTRIVLGNNTLKARSADGKEVELHNDELEKINQAIELETGSKIEQSGKNFIMKRGGVEAQTNFPISFNVATKTFTVTTPSGEKELKFMPDQALQKLKENKIISRIETSTQGGGAGTDTGFKLTELDSQPVFEVKGVSQQKFLGFVPVSISKTTFVSAESGNLVKTDVSVFNRLLDTISF